MYIVNIHLDPLCNKWGCWWSSKRQNWKQSQLVFSWGLYTVVSNSILIINVKSRILPGLSNSAPGHGADWGGIRVKFPHFCCSLLAGGGEGEKNFLNHPLFCLLFKTTHNKLLGKLLLNSRFCYYKWLYNRCSIQRIDKHPFWLQAHTTQFLIPYSDDIKGKGKEEELKN